jgi:hypothetical protein
MNGRVQTMLVAGLLMLAAACSKPATDRGEAPAAGAANDTAASGRAADDAQRTAKLSDEEVAHMAISIAPAEAARYAPETAGYAVVLSHDGIAQALADIAAADASVRQSDAVLARMDRLAGTPGADTAEAREAASRQAAADHAAQLLAQRRLSALLGQQPPWGSHADATLQDVAAGRIKVVRITFPLGSLRSDRPRELRFARLDASEAREQWHSRTVWEAPADATVPGRSFFALLGSTDAAEGEHLEAWAQLPDLPAQSGAWLPQSAVIASDGRYWYYVQKAPGEFERRPLQLSQPLRDGYFIATLQPGQPVVTAGAGLLLARELNPGTAAAD